MGYTNQYLFKEKILITGRVGTHGIIQRFDSKCWPSDNTLIIKSKWYEYVYQILKTINYTKSNRGSTQPLITQSDLKNIEIILPSEKELQEFENWAKSIMQKVDENKKENSKLSNLRDILLSKLMNGEIYKISQILNYDIMNTKIRETKDENFTEVMLSEYTIGD